MIIKQLQPSSKLQRCSHLQKTLLGGSQQSRKGIYTTKEAFNFLKSELQVQLPNQGARSVSQQAMQILTKVWKHKRLPPCIKVFGWRLIRRGIAAKISKLCMTCNMPENDAHLFFRCTFARAVWVFANPPLCTSRLPHEQDGVQEILSKIINHNTTDEQLHIILTTLWYLWKARNDLRFHRETWTIWQVHNAVAADIKAALLYCEQNDEQAHSTEERIGPLALPGNNLSCAGIITGGETRQISILPGPPLYQVLQPALLFGRRCYTDASTAPDHQHQEPRKARIGIFIIDPQQKMNYYIKAAMANSTSVIMAESAAMALAADICSALNLQSLVFLTDNQQLVTFFNSAEHSTPPSWDIKPYTQKFINVISANNSKVYKVARQLNITTHTLASQAFRTTISTIHFSCNNPRHVLSCPLQEALNSVGSL